MTAATEMRKHRTVHPNRRLYTLWLALRVVLHAETSDEKSQAVNDHLVDTLRQVAGSKWYIERSVAQMRSDVIEWLGEIFKKAARDFR